MPRPVNRSHDEATASAEQEFHAEHVVSWACSSYSLHFTFQATQPSYHMRDLRGPSFEEILQFGERGMGTGTSGALVW
jgi:hypothetical protein